MRVASLFRILAALATASCGADPQTSDATAGDMAISSGQAGNSDRKTSDAFATGSGAVIGSVRRDAAAGPRLQSAAQAPATMASGAPVYASLESSEPLPTAPQSIASSMIIRSGEARIEVDSVELAIARLRQLAQQLGGFVGNTTMQAGEREMRQATVELKVPAERFDAASAGLSALGKVEYVNVSAQDVGEEFVDITARVENARRLEQRLITLLATRTGRLEEVLSVERELARIRETIERYEGRLRYLRTRVAVSTLMVTVHEKAPLVGQLGSGNRIVEAFRNAWRNFVGFMAVFIESLGVLIPLGALAALVVWLLLRRRPRRPPPVPPVPPAAR